MDNVQTKPRSLDVRTLDFAADVIQFCKQMPLSAENKIITTQLLKSSTSIGANYAEANNSSSKLDFKNKIYIAKKEAAETRYWLRLAARANENIDTEQLIDEVSQLLLIFQKITNTLKNGK